MKLSPILQNGISAVSIYIDRATSVLSAKVAGAVLAGVMSASSPNVSAEPVSSTINTLPAPTITILGASTGELDIYQGGQVVLYAGDEAGFFQGTIDMKALFPENYTGYATLQFDRNGSRYQEILNVTGVTDNLGVLSISFTWNNGSYGALEGGTYPNVIQPYSTANDNRIYARIIIGNPVPEPSWIALAGLGLAGLGLTAGLRRKVGTEGKKSKTV